MSLSDTSSNSSKSIVSGVVLAGGKSSRMSTNKDKFLLEYQGKTLLEHVIELAAPQLDTLIVTINGDPARLPTVITPIISDQFGECAGPIAGILTAMVNTEHNSDWLATFPADSTEFPTDWVRRCINHAVSNQTPVVYASTRAGPHFTFALWSLALFAPLKKYFDSGNRSLKGFMAQYPKAAKHFDDRFVNINTAQDWHHLNNLGDATK